MGTCLINRVTALFRDIFKDVFGRVVREKNSPDEVTAEYLLAIGHEALQENEVSLKDYGVTPAQVSEFDGLLLKWYEAVLSHMQHYGYDWHEL